ncbi:unnamed protein product [Brassica napus]|uniref:(rape) hypothetical protein n=1 Tax=Brassica napus TaxID=3708 RepID=A0A816PNF2_BRANA|nr:unnamed protein product [Brassica napus]
MRGSSKTSFSPHFEVPVLIVTAKSSGVDEKSGEEEEPTKSQSLTDLCLLRGFLLLLATAALLLLLGSVADCNQNLPNRQKKVNGVGLNRFRKQLIDKQ